MTTFVLAIDASTYVGTVALIGDGGLVAAGEAAMRGEREERLLPAVEATLRKGGLRAGDVSHVVCGSGPGSFTSLRIAASIAKGLALGAGGSLRAVSSLALMVASLGPRPGRYLAALDAMRGDAYVSLVAVGEDGAVAGVGPARLTRMDAVPHEAAALSATAVGRGLSMDARPVASALTGIADELVPQVDLATWEPQYGRLAEAQVKWEATHGRPLQTR